MAGFPAAAIAKFIEGWEFFDPNPLHLRHGWVMPADGFGRNLAETLHGLSQEQLKHIVSATKAVLGVPEEIQTVQNDDGRTYFKQLEHGNQYPVFQLGMSNGTARMLALMTALHTQPGTGLIGLEEPENYVHPTALRDFVESVKAVEGLQFVMTTHSPVLLDCLADATAVRIVRRDGAQGTVIEQPGDAERVKRVLDASGLGLGQFYQTMGFGQ